MWIHHGETATTLHRRGTCGAWFFLPSLPTLFQPHCRRLFVIRKVSRGFVLYFPPLRVGLPRTFPLIRSFIRLFIHSFLHSFISSLIHSVAPSVVSSLWVPLWLRLCLFLCSSWLDFYFIFISISMKATCGRTLGHLSNFQSHIWRCHACVLFPAPHTHRLSRFPKERTYRKSLFRAT